MLRSKSNILVLLLCFISIISFAQSKDAAMKASVVAAAKKMDGYLMKKDYRSFVHTTYPKAVQMMDGGYDKLYEELKGQISTMEKANNTILSVWPGTPSNIIDTAGELQCTIPQFMKLKVDYGMLTTETTLIAFSMDKGKTWYFMDVVDRSLDKIREVFPGVSSKLVITKSPEPKFTRDPEKKVRNN